MTGLRGISARDYEFLRPSAGDPGFSEWEKAAPQSNGTPGLDPFPELDGADELRLVSGEQFRARWTGSSLHWSTSAKSRTSNLGPAGEIVRVGRLTLVLTGRRVAVIVPQEYISYEGIPGRGATTAPTIGDRLKMRAVRRIGTKVAPKLVDELLGDLSPRAGHVPLDCIASLATEGQGRALVVGLRIESSPRLKSAEIRIGMRQRDLQIAIDSIAAQVRERWSGVALPEPLAASTHSIKTKQGPVSARYTAPFFRPVGSRTVTTSDGADAWPAPSDLVPPAPRPVPSSSWTCRECGHPTPSEDPRCLRCRQARQAAGRT